MSILERSDVRFTHIDEDSFIIDTSPSTYRVVRNCLATLESEYALPVHYASEDMGAKMVVLSKALTGKVDTDQITMEDGLNPRYENKFLIPGSKLKKIGKSKEKMMELVKDIVSRLESLDLTVVIEEGEENTKQEDENIEYASPLVVTVIMEIILKSFSQLSGEQELWKNIPEETREILITANTDGTKFIVSKSEFIMRGLNAICVDLAKRVDDALKEYKKSHYFSFETTFEKNPDAAIKELGNFDGKKEARGFLQLLDLYYVFNVK